MAILTRWAERRPDGAEVIHAESAAGDDYTLCGYAVEGAGITGDFNEPACVRVSRGRIDCPRCLAVIRYAKSIPTKYLAPPSTL